MSKDLDKLLIHTGATLDRMARKKDRSVTFSFTTMQEISNEDFSVMDAFYQEAGHLLFRRNEFTEEDIPQEDVETDIGKSQSTQIRDALWVLYKTKGGISGDENAWNIFYKRNMQMLKARILEEVHKLEEG